MTTGRSIRQRAEAYWSDAARGSEKIEDVEERKSVFASYLQTVPPHPSVYFFESMGGARVMDSPFDLYLEFRRRSRSSGAEALFVWSVNSDKVVPDTVSQDPQVLLVKRHSYAYLYFLVRAGTVIGNSVLPEYFIRGEQQKYLNTWHGIGFKRLGRWAEAPLGADQSVRNMLQATHVISPCPFMTDILLDGFSMRHIFRGKLAETGYPRLDSTLGLSSDRREELVEELGIDVTLPTVLYAPTWRDGVKGPGFDLELLTQDLARLAELPANIVFLGHHLMLKELSLADGRFGGVIVPSTSMNTNELLGVVDVVVSDYSSVFFDVLAREIPIIHYVYDYDQYNAERGLALGLDELPGRVVRTSDELVDAVGTVISGGWHPDETYLQAKDRFAPYDDGAAADRVADWLETGNLVGGKEIVWDDLPRVGVWGGRLDEGSSTDAFLDMLESLADDPTQHTSVILGRSVAKYPKVVDRLRQLGDAVSVVTRASCEMPMTVPERRARKSRQRSEEDGSVLLYDTIFRREYRRLFGDARFDEVVHFSGLSHFWTKLSSFSER